MRVFLDALRRKEGGDAPGRPEGTEVWQPAPAVVSPGSAIANAPPADAIVLFDGGDLDEWVNTRDGAPAAWSASGGRMIVNKAAGNIETRRSVWQLPTAPRVAHPGDDHRHGPSAR